MVMLAMFLSMLAIFAVSMLLHILLIVLVELVQDIASCHKFESSQKHHVENENLEQGRS
jgi:hypothetical protein